MPNDYVKRLEEDLKDRRATLKEEIELAKRTIGYIEMNIDAIDLLEEQIRKESENHG